MKSISIRISDSELTAFRAHAEAQNLPLGTAIKHLARAGLQVQHPPSKTGVSSLDRCLSLLRLLSLYQLHQYHFSWLRDAGGSSFQKHWDEALSLANRSLDHDPELFGNARFRLPNPPKT